MELRQLRYFLSAARHLSFTRAAEECCIVQSAMSQQIRALEKELDVTLFERGKQGLRLTPEGRVAAEEARRLLKQAEAMMDAVRQAKNNARSTLRVGYQGNLLREAFPGALAAMRGKYPDISVFVKSGAFHKLFDALRDGELDCVLALYGWGIESADWVSSQGICYEELCAMLPARSPLAAKSEITARELRKQKLILLDREQRGDRLLELLTVDGQRPECMYADTQGDIETLVAAGCGVSICAKSAALTHNGITCRPVPELPRTQACLLWRRDMPDAERVHLLASFLVMTASETNGLF